MLEPFSMEVFFSKRSKRSSGGLGFGKQERLMESDALVQLRESDPSDRKLPG
jgi:hypothetical protein